MVIIILAIISIALGRTISLWLSKTSMKFLGFSTKFTNTKDRVRSIVIWSIIVFVLLLVLAGVFGII